MKKILNIEEAVSLIVEMKVHGDAELEEDVRAVLHQQLQKDHHSLHTSLVAAVEGIDEYQEAYDHDGHRYEIPRSKSLDWENFLEIPEDDERSWDVPEWAERIDGIAVRSIKEQVLTIINSIFKE